MVHGSLVITNGLNLPASIASNLISSYAKFDDLGSCLLVFNALKERNTFIWNYIIKVHVDLGVYSSALLLYKQMRKLSVPHDSFTFPIINRMVVLLQSDIRHGKMVHCLAMKMGFGWDVYFCNTMMELYGKSGCSGCARQLFDEISERDLVSWTSMISLYVREGDAFGAFELFRDMQMVLEPNSVTMMVMLQAASNSLHCLEGRQLHTCIKKKGFLSDLSVGNSLLKIYANKGCADDAEILFGEIDEKDIISWNTMISSFCLTKQLSNMVDWFNKMLGEVTPNSETLTLLVSALSEDENCCLGEEIHCFAIKSGLCDHILKTSLLDLYAKRGCLDESVRLFQEIPHVNNITWNSMMSGYICNGYFVEAIELFKQMLAKGFEPVIETLKSLVVSCSHMGALRLGKAIHGYQIRNLYYDSEDNHHTPLETSILNMYLRCGCISAARICFNRMVHSDLVSWTSMIEGYGIHGLGFEALSLFDRMMEEGIKPNRVTFLSLLSACSHSGLLHEGCEIFYLMRWRFGIQPDLNHYTCIVDLLGRCGKIKEALAIILKLVVSPDSRIWGALLGSCRVYEDQKHGEYAARCLLELEPGNVGYKTLLSHVQASVERWEKVEELRSVIDDKGLVKLPGWSCLVT